MFWENLREEEFADAVARSGKLCVMSIGCVEKHGQHLPLGTDSIGARGVCEIAAGIEDVVLFPDAVWLGDVGGMHSYKTPLETGFAGFIALSPELLLKLLEELCDEIARNGFTKILIVNNHGGNTSILNTFLRAQEHKGKKYATMWTNVNDDTGHKADLFYEHMRNNRADYPMITDADLEVLKGFAKREDGYGGGHGDFTETARVMGIRPKTVAVDRFDAESGVGTGKTRYLKNEGIFAVEAYATEYPNCLKGHPYFGCSESIGQAINLYAARRLARIFKLLKNDSTRTSSSISSVYLLNNKNNLLLISL